MKATHPMARRENKMEWIGRTIRNRPSTARIKRSGWSRYGPTIHRNFISNGNARGFKSHLRCIGVAILVSVDAFGQTRAKSLRSSDEAGTDNLNRLDESAE